MQYTQTNTGVYIKWYTTKEMNLDWEHTHYISLHNVSLLNLESLLGSVWVKVGSILQEFGVNVRVNVRVNIGVTVGVTLGYVLGRMPWWKGPGAQLASNLILVRILDNSI